MAPLLNNRQHRGVVLGCFSPPVMIATFVIEVAMAVYAIWHYRMSSVVRVAVLSLLILAVFQVAEFSICTTSVGHWPWARLGYSAIAMLPPLGIHLIYSIAKLKRRVLQWPAYISALVFIAYFNIFTDALDLQACLGNYVIFRQSSVSVLPFAAYYYGWLITGIILCFKLMQQKISESTRHSLLAVAVGYAAFILPTTTANIANPATIKGIPSIMCGFAVLYGLIIGLYVLPRVARKKPR